MMGDKAVAVVAWYRDLNMNSYPIELLAQLAPVMFAAGLESTASISVEQPPSPQDPFVSLSARLREALLSRRKVAIWQPEKPKAFQVVLVDKDVRFPPRKLIPQDDPQYSNAHSPLSPLTPSSPLYPDGLIAPIWIRKHTTLLPSVFVLFLRLFELPALSSRSPLDIPDREREKERDQEERKRDTELSAEVASRKKTTSERGIKLTVVLMASRKMLGASFQVHLAFRGKAHSLASS
jgi:trafficking protein particle complex subunit 11